MREGFDLSNPKVLKISKFCFVLSLVVLLLYLEFGQEIIQLFHVHSYQFAGVAFTIAFLNQHTDNFCK